MKCCYFQHSFHQIITVSAEILSSISIRMISEGSCDAKDRRNGCWKFSFAITGINSILQYENNYFISQFYCFYLFFLFKKNAGLIVSIILLFCRVLCILICACYISLYWVDRLFSINSKTWRDNFFLIQIYVYRTFFYKYYSKAGNLDLFIYLFIITICY